MNFSFDMFVAFDNTLLVINIFKKRKIFLINIGMKETENSLII